MNENDEIIEKGTIAIDDNRITYVGPDRMDAGGSVSTGLSKPTV